MKNENSLMGEILVLEMEIHLTPELAYDGEIKVEQPDGFLKTVPQYHLIVKESEVDRLSALKIDGTSSKDETAYYRVLKPETIQFCGFFRHMMKDLSSSDSEETEEPKKIITRVVAGADRGLLDLVLDFLEYYATLPDPEKWRNEHIEERRKGNCYLPEDEISEWDASRFAGFHSWRLLQLSKVVEYFDCSLMRMKNIKWLVHHETKGFDDIKVKEYFGTNREFTEEEKEKVRKETGILWL